jgi:tRNA (guanine-N(7)-)-methyltransferase
MRLRNIAGANEKIINSKYIILDYKSLKGNYQSVFSNNNPIHLEIGMGRGKFIIENAKRYPDINFIGIERFDSVIVRALDKLEEEDIPNLKLIRVDATEIGEVFEKEIETLYLNFSDPWPKIRHTNRRLSSKIFLERYDNIFKDLKRIVMKTDNRHLFEFSVCQFTAYGYRIEELILDLYSEDISLNIPTEYEDKFHNKGQAIYKIEVQK